MCVGDKRDDGQDCDNNANCVNGACALETYDEMARKVCCPKGKSYYFKMDWKYGSQYFCGDLKDGERRCGHNNMCRSKICINRQCVSRRLDDLQACDEHTDCANQMCARASDVKEASLVCCPGGDASTVKVSWTYRSQLVCSSSSSTADAPVPSKIVDWQDCAKNSDCANGACAKKHYSKTAPLVCCPNGEQYQFDVSWTYSKVFFCGGLSDGDTCGHHLQCYSGVCLDNTCRRDRRADGSQCLKSSDCVSGTCALKYFDKSAPMVCCGKGEAYYLDVPWTYKDFWFCGGLQTNEMCGSNLQCDSGICINGICQETTLNDGDACTQNNNCENGSCAMKHYEKYSPTVCCKSGEMYALEVSYSYKDFNFCGGLVTGDVCGSRLQCDSGICINNKCGNSRLMDLEPCSSNDQCIGGACAMQYFDKTAPMVCCAKGEAYYLDVPWAYKDFWFCGRLQTKEMCGSNLQCDSGICINGNCQDSRLNDGEACTHNTDCQTGACALKRYEKNAPKTCCDGGEMYLLDVSWSYKDYWFCGGLSQNDTCGSDSQCKSGICIDGQCRDKPLEDGMPCATNADCVSGTCAFQSFDKLSPTVCCAGGEAYYLDVPWTYKDYWFCGGLKQNGSCGHNLQCLSGICIDNSCQQDRRKELEPCTENADCQNGACAFKYFDKNAPTVCCPNGEAHLLDVPWTYKDYYFCGGLSTNDEACGSNLQCASGICIGGACRSERLGDGQNCKENADCLHGVCAGDEYKKDFKTVCCTGGERHLVDVPWTYKDYYFCGKLASGMLCWSNDMCDSKSCSVSGRCM